jgi:hypothetical protein
MNRGPLWRSGFILIMVLAALFLMAGCNKPPAPALAGWKPFSPDGKFTVLMPGVPVEQPPVTNSEFEAKKFSIRTAMSHVSGLAIAYADQPNRPVQSDPNKIMDALREQAKVDLRGQLLSEKPITLQGYPGRELRLSIPDGYEALQRIYLVDKRLYSLIVIAGSKGLDSPEAKKFLDSFQVTP